MRVFFVAPHDGDTVPSTFPVRFGVEGKTIRPAGEDVMDKTSGHHHLFIDDPVGYIELGQPSPADGTHIHYGKGETETMLTLPPGRHKLSLQFADGAHLSYGKEMSATISVTVQEPAAGTPPAAAPAEAPGGAPAAAPTTAPAPNAAPTPPPAPAPTPATKPSSSN